MLPTAFEPDGSLDEAGIAALIDSIHGFDAFAGFGFGSECLQLTIAERILVAAMAADRRANQGLVDGCTATGEDEACSLVEHAASVGADGVATEDKPSRANQPSTYRLSWAELRP